MAEQLSQDAIMELIRAQYPELVPLLQQPGVWDAISTAVEGNYSPARLQASLQATDYYRNTPANERAWYITATIDPATAAMRSQQYQQKMSNLVQQTGINPNGQVASQLLHDAIVNQWSDTEFKMNLLTRGYGQTDASGTVAGLQKPGGELAANATQVHALASQYGVPISDQAALDWGAKLTAGSVDQNAVTGYMIEQAGLLYPSLAGPGGALDQGITVANYMDSYKQIAVQELGMNPSDFNLSNPKWSAPLVQVDPKTGTRVQMNLQDWQTKLRTDPTYGYDSTQGAKNQAATLVSQLGQKLGVLG